MLSTQKSLCALISCSAMDYEIDSDVRCLRDELVTNAVSGLAAAGIEAQLIPNLHQHSSPKAALTQADMLVVLGGYDVHPMFYGQSPHANTYTLSDEKGDQSELELIREAVATGMPVLSICRGMQLLNVALGGSLIQEVGEDERHYIPADRSAFVEHKVEIFPETYLASAFSERQISIRSAHHQSVQTLGEGLRIAALADDGVVEAIELKGENLVIGVQWHPEDARADPQQFAALAGLFVRHLEKTNNISKQKGEWHETNVIGSKRISRAGRNSFFASRPVR